MSTARPMAMPRDTARPCIENVIVSPPGRPKAKRGPLGGQEAKRSGLTWGLSFPFSELVVDEGDERVERFLFLVADRFDRDFAADARGQHHHAHDALRIHAPFPLADPDL